MYTGWCTMNPPRANYTPVGFEAAKQRAIKALRSGDGIEHEARDALASKNLLAIGAISCDFVANLLNRCKGGQHISSPHDFDARTEVHVFKPVDVAGKRWYIKLYFRTRTVFISVH